MAVSPPRPRRRTDWVGSALVVLASLGAHVLLVAALIQWGLPFGGVHPYEAPVSVRLLSGDVIPGDVVPPSFDSPDAVVVQREEAEPEPEEEKPPEDPEYPDGQIVDTPPPLEEKIPVKADYLAEYNNAVPEETQARRFKVNPDILAPTYSEESRMELKDVQDVGATQASTGATAGGIDASEPGKGAPRSRIPSEFSVTNKEGLAAPMMASSSRQDVRGAPQNDRLDEKYGAAVALNTREFYGAEYINRIRRQVNFWWSQNLDNLSPSVRLGKPRYRTVVSVVLDANGNLESIEVTDESGSPPVDSCVVEAFKIAGPYPNPPEQLVAIDNRVYLPDFDFQVNIGQAQMQFQGVDPRANVQFPGILNAPR